MSWRSAEATPPPPPPPEDDDDVPPPPPPSDVAAPVGGSPAKKPPVPNKPLPGKPPTPAKPLPAPPPKGKPAATLAAIPVTTAPPTTPTKPSTAVEPSPTHTPEHHPSPSVVVTAAKPSAVELPVTPTKSPVTPSSPATASPASSPFPGIRHHEGSPFPGIRHHGDKAESPSSSPSPSSHSKPSWVPPSLGNWSKSVPTFLKSGSDKEISLSATSSPSTSGTSSPANASPVVARAPLPHYEPPARGPLKAPKIGKLRLIVTEGRNLSMRGKEAPDAQCVVGPVDDAGNIIVAKAVKTEIVRNSARPVWSSVFNFATKEDFKGLLLECWDEGKKRRFLGQVDFPPQILIDGREIVTWFSLGKKPSDKSKQADVKGDIYLSILFSEGAVVEEPPEEKKPAKKTDLKRAEQADAVLSDVKGGGVDALKALTNYVTTTSVYGEKDAQIIDPEFAQAVVKKNGIDALLDALKSTENGEALALICFIFSILSEVDSETGLLLASRNVAASCLQKLKTVKPISDYSKALAIFNISGNVESRQQFLDGEAPAYLLELLKSNLSDGTMVAVTVKALNGLVAEASESIKKTIAQLVLQNNIDTFIGILDSFSDNEQVIEPAITFFDHCFEFVTPISAVGTKGIDIILRLMQKYRLTVQVHGASILSRLMEEADYAQHTAATGVPIFVKMLGTEFFLRHYEQRSRELSLKCLNRCANSDENIHAMRDAGVIKFLDAAMRTYATMIVQLQGVLLIKALSKDEVCRQQLVQIGIGQLLTSAAGKHPTLTRLHKMVDDLKATYGW
eukprot:TRINITY_DN274_c0_g1_i1.p1 TRINITY_DN274_c0_g1~~TRINITY_DN274_c0_g1_i1.p1  ORF type:complete len:791 (+),score=211.97 TRINITY_DN274_c0_g1_i1:213-2585(+)